MDRITRFSLKNATVIVVAMLMVTIGGFYTADRLERETMPDVSIPIVAVVTPYPGAAPADVYDKVTRPMDRALIGVPGVQELQSTSADSVSVAIAEFSYSADMDEAEAEVIRAMEGVELPENALEPETARITFGSQPILKIAVSGGESFELLRSIVRKTVVPRLSAVDGVGEITASDEGAGAVRIEFDPDALDSHDLTAEGVVQQLQAANVSFPVGALTVDSLEEPVRVSGTLETIEDIKGLKIVAFGDALERMGELGTAVGDIGTGVGELGTAVGELGEGLEEMAEGFGAQLGLLIALQDTQVQLLDAKIALAEANNTISDPGATPAEVAAAQATAAEMQATIPGLEAAIAGIEGELEAAQAAAGTSSQTTPSLTAGVPATSTVTTATAVAQEAAIDLVTLGDLAEVTFDSGVDDSFSRRNGESAVLIDIVKTQDANTVDVSDLVAEELIALEDELPEGAEAAITYDAAVRINRSIWDMVREGLLGGLFAFLVILAFLRNLRSTLIAAISIPLSVVTALLFLGWFDITLNVMTLGGLTVAIGRVVDDSIVVIENIYRHLQIGDRRDLDVIRLATREVSAAITSSTLTTVAVFAPMALVSGIVGKVFTPFALTVGLALLASLLVAVTVVPLLAKWAILHVKVPPRDEEVIRETGYYALTLRWALDYKKTVIALAFLLFAASMALVPVIGVGFMPPETEKFASIDVSFPAGTTAESVDGALQGIEEDLGDLGTVEYYQAAVGVSSGFDIVSGTNQGSIFMKFRDEVDLDEAVEELREMVEPLKRDDVRVTVAPSDVSGAGHNSVDLIITGPDFEHIRASAGLIEEAIVDVGGIENVSSNVSDARPQVLVEVDQEKAAGHGLNAAMVAGSIRAVVADLDAGKAEIAGRDVDLTYSVALGEMMEATDIAQHEIVTPLDKTVTVGEVARVEETETPVAVLALDEREFAAVSASVTDRDSGGVIRAIQDEIDELVLPEGVEVEVSGMAEMMADSFQQLGIAMLIAVAAVYLVMVIAFGEAIAPLAIMGSLPLATIGGILALFLMGLPLDMPAMIGALMLIGIVTTNAIVLIDRVQQRLGAGLTRREALIEAGAERIRPILMTALTTIFALLPLAAGLAEGALTSQSLATVVVGGLTTSTVLTLIVVPVVYDWLEALKERVLAVGMRRRAV